MTIELTCDTSPVIGWLVNGIGYVFSELQDGILPGHNVNGSNILITSNPMNNSQYICSDGFTNGGVYHILVAGGYADLFVMCRYESYTHNRL